MDSDLYVATEAQSFDLDGQPQAVDAGTVVVKGHRAMRGRENLWQPLVIKLAFDPDLPPSKATIVVTGSADGLGEGTLAASVMIARTQPADAQRTR